MIPGLIALFLLLAVPGAPGAPSRAPGAADRALPGRSMIGDSPKPGPRPAPPDDSSPPAPPNEPVPPGLQCKLLTEEGPRGGRAEVEGAAFGKTPVVRIGGRVVRLLERMGARIAVQIPRDSDGGAVTVAARGQEAACGALTIIGKN